MRYLELMAGFVEGTAIRKRGELGVQFFRVVS